jgi:hypothetical protein
MPGLRHCLVIGSIVLYVGEILSLSWYVYWRSGYFKALNQRSFLAGLSVLVCNVSAEGGVIRHIYGAFRKVPPD